ncbi:PREDICTED: RHOMBOID-like protein 8 isoform X1 [Theobroma cacao]|uniref:RHOMBOID-like protein n=1 Tax=Theobroma cacao TaxID=3641 RepID=A0AB32WMQ8_THECC|nr:PREDICTED: RHOMBOID-like protein 8 isoform X1 [Theobroma cacao]
MEEATPANQPHTQIEIKPQSEEAPPPISPSLGNNHPESINQPEGRFPFFKSRYRQRSSDTWLISIFVILHLLAFITTMLFNYFSLGSALFQPLSENPLLGPSASTLEKVGALQRADLAQNHRTWRLFVCPWLHAGVIHFAINISCIIFVGIHLERDYGPLRIGIIYLLSAFFGSLVCSLFVRNSPVVTSSDALFGLLGAMLSGIIRNWKVYTNKVLHTLLLVPAYVYIQLTLYFTDPCCGSLQCAALAVVFIVFAINFLLGLLPYIDNFANIGAFMSGFLLGFVFLFTPQIRQLSKNKAGLFEYSVKSSINLKQKLKPDRPILRSVSLLLFIILLVGCLEAVFRGIDINHYCGWCTFIDCIPSKRWNCNDRTNACEIMTSNSDLTLTCLRNGNFRVLPSTNISQARITDLCSMIC